MFKVGDAWNVLVNVVTAQCLPTSVIARFGNMNFTYKFPTQDQITGEGLGQGAQQMSFPVAIVVRVFEVEVGAMFRARSGEQVLFVMHSKAPPLWYAFRICERSLLRIATRAKRFRHPFVKGRPFPAATYLHSCRPCRSNAQTTDSFE